MTQQPGAATAQQQPLVDLGTALVHAWTHRTGWIYRRTERYEFSHEDTLRCEIQLELTIRPAMPRILPASGPEVCMVPLMLVKKGATPLDICVRDGSGNFLRHLEGKDVQDVNKEVLRAAAALSLQEVIADDLGQALDDVVSEPPSAETFDAVRSFLRDRQLGREQRDSLEYWVNLLSEWSFVYIQAPTSGVLTVSIGYDVAHSWQSRTLVRRLGWDEWSCSFRAAAGDAMNYHFELAAPEGIEISALEFRASLQPVDFRPSVHKHVARLVSQRNTAQQNYTVVVGLRIARGGWLTGATAAAMSIVGILFFTASFVRLFTKRDTVSTHPATDVVFLMATLFLAVGAAIIAVLARANEHRLTSHFLSLLRLFMTLLTLIAFAAVLVLVSVRDPDMFWWYFMGLASVATPLATLMVAAWCYAGGTPHD